MLPFFVHTVTLTYTLSVSLNYLSIFWPWPQSQMNLPIMRSRIQTGCCSGGWQLASQITDHFPSIVHFLPSPCWLSLSRSLLMNSGTYAINIYIISTITPLAPFSSQLSHTQLFLSVLLSFSPPHNHHHHHPYTNTHTHFLTLSFSCYHIWQLLCSKEPEIWGVTWKSENMSADTEREGERSGKEWGARLNRSLAQEGDISNTILSGTRKCFADRRCTHNVWHMRSHVQSGSIWKRKCVLKKAQKTVAERK